MPHFNLTASVDYFFNFFLMKGVLVTIGLTVAGVVGGLILGMGIALMRMSLGRQNMLRSRHRYTPSRTL